MIEITSISEIMSLVENTQDGHTITPTVRFNEDVVIYCSLGNLQERLDFKIQVNGRVCFKNVVNVINVKATGDIESDHGVFVYDGVESEGSIKTGTFIDSYGFIRAVGDIDAGTFINARLGIISGGLIKAWSVKSDKFEIKCKSLKTTRLPFGRNFWSEMVPLKKWKDAIMNERNCWNDLKKLATIEEKEKICNWEGWHPIHKAQLEMFFEIKNQVSLS